MDKNNRTSITLPPGFNQMFKDIRQARPDLNNDSEVGKEAVRLFWKAIQNGKEKRIDISKEENIIKEEVARGGFEPPTSGL